MSEEEKKTVELLKQTIDHNSSMYIDNLGDSDIIIILKLIEKQQKEIEAMKIACNECFELQQKEIKELKEDLGKKVKALDIAMSNPDYICKDKIREKIKELEDIDEYEAPNGWESERDYAKGKLKELLEE